MEHGDIHYPPMLPNLKSLSRAKQEGFNKEIGVNRSNTVLESLWSMKQDVQRCKFVRKIGCLPFEFVYFFAPEQTTVHNKNNKVADSSFSLDATSSVARDVVFPDSSTQTIFLLQGVEHFHDKIYPSF